MLLSMENTVQFLAQEFHQKGLRALIVGGWVRDRALQQPSKDIDLEIYGDYTVDWLIGFLTRYGEVNAVGSSFGVLKLRVNGHDLDVSIPRRENKQGQGHKGFLVEPDPTMTPTEAAARRDFTMNALAYDPLRGSTLDPFGGIDDLHDGILSATGPAFAEDPLRVLRGFQFCGRFNLEPDRETVFVCRDLQSEYHTLSLERVWGEWEKWAGKSVIPSSGLVFLEETDWIGFYPELENLIGLEQDPNHHPEGDAWEHTVQTVDAMQEICAEEGIVGEDQVVLILAALLHDVGKVPTTEWNEEKRRITSYNHDIEGGPLARAFLKRIGAPKRIIDRVIPLVTMHMRHVNYHTGGNPEAKHVRRLARDLAPATMQEWARVVEADCNGRHPLPGGLPAAVGLMLDIAEELAILDSAPEPLLMGRHLIELGMQPGPHFGDILRAAYEAQLDGQFTNLAGALRWYREFKTELA